MATLTLTAAANAAAQYLGVLDSGEALSSQQVSDALAAANALIDNWSVDPLMAVSATISTVSTTSGVSSYALGARVSAVAAASVLTPSPASPLKVVTALEWANIPDRGVAGSLPRLLVQASMGIIDPIEYSQFSDAEVSATILRLAAEKRPDLIQVLSKLARLSTGNTFQPRYLFYDRGLTTGTIYLAGSPQTGTLQLVTWTALAAFADATTPRTMEPGYARMLELALAVELAPQYDVSPSQALAANMADSVARIKALNASVLGSAPAEPVK